MKHVFLLLVAAILAGCNSNKSELAEQEKPVPDTAGISIKSIDDLHKRLALKNYDKGLIDYIRSNPNKVDSAKKVIYLLPFGNMKPEVEEIIESEADYLEAFFQLDVKMLDRIPYDSIKKISAIKTRLVPESDFDYYSKMKGGTPNLTEQIQVKSFIDVIMRERKPKDAVAFLAITEHDIYNPKYYYLFGISGLNDGIGLVSTFRLIDYVDQTKHNIRKVVSKQIANMFSIGNVKDYECVLNFHNDESELAKGEFKLLPRALEKLKFAIGFDYQKRFSDLQAFWSKEQNKKEEGYYLECLKRVRQASQ